MARCIVGIVGLVLLVGFAGIVVPASANSVCPGVSQATHTYGPATGVSVLSRSSGMSHSASLVSVFDSNLAECNGDDIPDDFDGDLDAGFGGAFFGLVGDIVPAEMPSGCGYDLNTHAPGFVVAELGSSLGVTQGFVGEDDRGEVVVVQDVDGSFSCTTDGLLSPGDPGSDMFADPGDCGHPFSTSMPETENVTYATGDPNVDCAPGQVGGDGGYWVMLTPAAEEQAGRPLVGPAFAGTITAAILCDGSQGVCPVAFQ